MFSDSASTGGFHDDNGGLDYHTPIEGSGEARSLATLISSSRGAMTLVEFAASFLLCVPFGRGTPVIQEVLE